MNFRKHFAWALVILWMAVIFSLSAQPASASNDLSRGITALIIDLIQKILPMVNLTLNDFNHYVRKNAHFIAYFLLGFLVINALMVGETVEKLKNFKERGSAAYRRRWLLAGLICVSYAISDEVHQLFVPGRGGQVKDVLIDSGGAATGILVYVWGRRLLSRWRVKRG
ncbi:VanZ family protein [Acidaminobacter hydrogenoformans]|uniref:VanZ like family protein n=1 Tax=Acidaminobacter hydrogenoformans DSM 2784 TaxID=1120920 RepID=A0A1G5RW14_9FIRM|nr:VanZ family protein [Acidaminobacter hydrogenoformans]SCZ78107.1 VanZ like family protein [Acidaminobacter hydrogenoformans DSM 2784]